MEKFLNLVRTGKGRVLRELIVSLNECLGGVWKLRMDIG